MLEQRLHELFAGEEGTITSVAMTHGDSIRHVDDYAQETYSQHELQ